MHPEELYDDHAQTAAENLQDLHAEYESGSIRSVAMVHGYLTFFRQLGACRMFASGMPDALFIAQQQAASGYLFRLPGLDPDDLATSVAPELWDAIGGEYWDAAREIARGSRPTWNPKREHEDDFLYVYFMMKRFLLDAEADEQEALLSRWAEIIEDELSPKLDLCRALLESEADDVLDALERIGADRAAEVARRIEAGSLGPDLAAWLRPYWNEGLALVRLIEREGIEVPPMLPQVPDVARTGCPFRYDPYSWKYVDYRASLRA